ncbi:tyrosine--tRNA ligase, partial [Patescibacteria group bacterium]|nr:tyrosine--tRNA ligase [Patescibacteria group bacterium]
FGVDEDKIGFITGKNLYTNNIVHWETFMEVGKHVTLSRNLRSISIMGKTQGKDVDMATLFYPPLQVADIFTMKVNLAHAGMDQRKAHVVARQVAKKLIINPLRNVKDKVIAPIAVHQNLIAGLGGPEKGENSEESLKMSKSKPNSAVFVHDSPDEIRKKIKKAYGPPVEIEFNPLINWVKTLVFWGEGESKDGLKVKRAERFGGDVSYCKIDDLVDDYKSEKLHPMDLKNALSKWLIEKLGPARKHFENAKAKNGLRRMKELILSSRGTK